MSQTQSQTPRKKHFESSLSQQRRNKLSIAKRLWSLEEFCKSIGLRVDQIIFSPYIDRPETNPVNPDEEYKEVKLTFKKDDLGKENKTFQLLKAKDKTNMSDSKYMTFRNILNEILPEKIPCLDIVNNMQKRLNRFF